MSFTDLSDAEILRRGNEAFNRSVQEEAKQNPDWGGDYDPAKYQWSESPPENDNICRECYKWQRFPPGQRHFGYAWWRVCDSHECQHEHHAEEIWLG